MDGGARPRERRSFGAGAIFFLPALAVSSMGRVVKDVDQALFFGNSVMSNASFASRPLGTAMVGGAIAMAILDLLVRKNILTVDDVQGALTTAQSSLISSPQVQGSLDGARVIGEIKDLFARRERGHWTERRG
jgi:hypothetical protein